MKRLLVLLIFLAGCYPGKTVTRDETVGYTPKPITDTTSHIIYVRQVPNCDSAITAAISEFVDRNITDTTKQGDAYSIALQAVKDSMQSKSDSIRQVYRWRLSVALNAQGHKDSVVVAVVVREVSPLTLWQRIECAVAPSLMVIVGGIVLIVVLIVVLKVKIPL
jgi:hypothetical protein